MRLLGLTEVTPPSWRALQDQLLRSGRATPYWRQNTNVLWTLRASNQRGLPDINEEFPVCHRILTSSPDSYIPSDLTPLSISGERRERSCVGPTQLLSFHCRRGDRRNSADPNNLVRNRDLCICPALRHYALKRRIHLHSPAPQYQHITGA